MNEKYALSNVTHALNHGRKYLREIAVSCIFSPYLRRLDILLLFLASVDRLGLFASVNISIPLL